MSNRKYRTCAASRTTIALLLLCMLTVQVPGMCACRILETPCAAECRCAVQKRPFTRQSHRVEINDSCDVHSSSGSIDHSPCNPKRECQCTSSSPLAMTRLTTPVELDVNYLKLVGLSGMVSPPQWSLNVSPDSIRARGPHTSLARCVFMCRLTL